MTTAGCIIVTYEREREGENYVRPTFQPYEPAIS